jgi:hypothetical protein
MSARASRKRAPDTPKPVIIFAPLLTGDYVVRRTLTGVDFDRLDSSSPKGFCDFAAAPLKGPTFYV